MTALPPNPSVLAIDTATNLCSVAFISNDNIVEMQRDLPRAHNQHILQMISEVTGNQDLSEIIDVIACGVGPGSFTGIRVAVGVAQGLGWSLDRPVHPFCSLKAQALDNPVPMGTKVLSLIDAQIGQVYWCWFEMRSSGLTALCEPTISVTSDITQSNGALLQDLGDSVVVCGDACAQVVEAHPSLKHSDLRLDARPRPSQCALAFLDFPENSTLVEASSLEPRYVQQNIGWKKLSEQGKRL